MSVEILTSGHSSRAWSQIIYVHLDGNINHITSFHSKGIFFFNILGRLNIHTSTILQVVIFCSCCCCSWWWWYTCSCCWNYYHYYLITVTNLISLFAGYESRKILRLSKAAAIASVVAFTIFVTYLYAASSEFGIYSNRKHVDAWHWWSLQTILRLEEIVACCLVLMIAFRNPCQRVCSVSRCFGKIGNSTTLPDVEKTNDLGADSSPGVTVATIQISPRKWIVCVNAKMIRWKNLRQECFSWKL